MELAANGWLILLHMLLFMLMVIYEISQLRICCHMHLGMKPKVYEVSHDELIREKLLDKSHTSCVRFDSQDC